MRGPDRLLAGALLLVILATGCGPARSTLTPAASSAALVATDTVHPPTATPTMPMPTPLPPTPTPVPATATEPPDPNAEIRESLGYVPVFEPAICRFTKPAQFEAECGYLIVPQDRSQPDGLQVRMHAIVFRSRNPEPAPDPLIYLTGGGGGNTLDGTVGYLDDGNDAILDDRDFIMYNQRGAKYSVPYVQCPGYGALLEEAALAGLSEEEVEARKLAFLGNCRDQLAAKGVDLDLYNSSVNAADLNDLRIALGYDKINIYGTSYGTRLALYALRDYGEYIRSAIIDSVFPPQIHYHSEFGTNAYETFARIFEACVADADCRERYPDSEAKLAQVIEELNRAPASMRWGLDEIRYDGVVFVWALYLLPYLAEAGTVPAAIHAASQGDFSLIEGLVPAALDIGMSDVIAWGVQNSILCREEIGHESYDRLLDLASLLPPAIAGAYDSTYPWDLCQVWDVEAAPAGEKEPVESDVPVLILTGEFDPITPPKWGWLAGETLSSSYYYEFRGLGHGIMRSNRCGFQIGYQFLSDPYTEPDASCLEELPLVEWK
jgi:pimeloyl-ACP methyl ester carboxylesterase